MSIREDAIMMLLGSGGGGSDIAELTVEENGTYYASDYTNVDGVAVLITDPDTQKAVDGFEPVNVQIDIEEEKKKAYDEGYSDGYADGQKDPDPPYKDVIEDIIGKPPFTPPTETFGGEGTDPSDTISDIIDYYSKHPIASTPPVEYGVAMDVEGEKTPINTISFLCTDIGSMKGCALKIGDVSVWTWANGDPTTTYSDMYVDTNGIAHLTITTTKPDGTTRTTESEQQIPSQYLSDTVGTPYTVTMGYNYTYNP